MDKYVFTKLDSSGEERDRRSTLMLTLIGPTGGLFLLSYLVDYLYQVVNMRKEYLLGCVKMSRMSLSDCSFPNLPLYP